jgi:hypothetical protein
MSTKGSVHQIRDQNYYIEISLYNQIDGEKPLNLPFFFVDSLMITESLQNFYTRGEIVFNDPFEIISRGAIKTTDALHIPNIKPYIDRTDGRNRLSIKLYPVDPESTEKSGDKFPKEFWEMSFDFIITDVEDLDVDNAQRKKRKYKFVEERYQTMIERNLEWSTAQLAGKKLNKKAYQLKDEEAALNPNDVLKELISIIATNQKTSDKIKIGYEESGSIDNPTIPFDNFSEDWDAGDPKTKFLYYSPANTNGLDDVFAVLSRCVSSDGGPVILDFGRTTKDKKWSLKSLAKYFENSSKQQVERVIIADGVSPEGSTPYVARAENDKSTNTHNFTSIVASKINRYKFAPMVSLDDNRLINRPLHYYNHSTGEFNIKMEKNTAKVVVDRLKSYAKKGLYAINKGSGGQVLLNLNKTKDAGIFLKNEFSVNQFISDAHPANKMLLDSLFLNECFCFQSIGLTLRSPGRFLFVDRIAAGENNPFDDRFLGQWMIIKVTHLFTQQEYHTEVIAVKVDSFSKLWPETESKY